MANASLPHRPDPSGGDLLHRGTGHHRRQRSDAPVPQSLGGSMLHDTETLENPTRTIITGIRTPKRPAHTISSLMLRFWRAIPATKATINPRFSELCIKGKWASGRTVPHQWWSRGKTEPRSGWVHGRDLLRWAICRKQATPATGGHRTGFYGSLAVSFGTSTRLIRRRTEEDNAPLAFRGTSPYKSNNIYCVKILNELTEQLLVKGVSWRPRSY